MKKQTFIAFTVLIFSIIQLKAQVEPSLLYKVAGDEKCREWVESQMAHMTKKEKVGQLFIYTAALRQTKRNMELIREAVRTYKVGGLLFSGGTLVNQATLTNYAQSLARVPLLMTFDGEWGLSMRLRSTPAFPKNGVLGCIQDNDLLRQYGKEVARQCREVGVHVNFAPDADVNINPDNPVINIRSFGENPHNVAEKVVAYASGLESGGILSVAKHFPGHGDTDVDSHKSLPVLPFTRARMDSVELYPFKKVIEAGLGGIMVGHLQVPAYEPTFPSSLSRNIVYDLLEKELKFNGLVFTDALQMKGVLSGEVNLSVAALKAGNDLLLIPRNIKREMEAVLAALDSGELKEEDINNKCRKVLIYKYALGVQDNNRVRLSGLEKRINTPYADELISRLRLAAVTVLGNRKQTIPLHSDMELAVLSVGEDKADADFVRFVGRYVPVNHYSLNNRMTELQVAELKKSLAKYKRVVVSVTTKETKHFEDFFSALSVSIPTVYVYFTQDKVMEQTPVALYAAAATILAHSAQPELQRHVAGVLFGKELANGRLSMSVRGIYRAGDGVTISSETPHYYAPEDYGMNPAILARIDTIANEGIMEGAYPGCRIVVLKDGKPVYNKCFGYYTYEKEHKVFPTDMYDLASLSKTTGTLLALMKLYDKGMLNLTDKIFKFLPFLKGTDKENITVKDLLYHESGLPASLPFYQLAIDKKSYKGGLFKKQKDATHTVRVGENNYMSSTYKYKKGLVSSVPSDVYTLQVADSFYLHKDFHNDAMKMIADAPLKKKEYVYSDVNFILLKEIVESISRESLDSFLDRAFFQPMGLTHTAYLPLRRFDKTEVAPTMKDGLLRKGILQGYVHDESAAFLGGVSGNAGLFSTASDVAAIYQMLLNNGEYEGKRYLSAATCRLFTTSKSSISRRGLGFDRQDGSVYGHTGFTGTCAWVNPDNHTVYVFLSNRTYPHSWNNKLLDLDIRPRIQEAIYQSMSGK